MMLRSVISAVHAISRVAIVAALVVAGGCAPSRTSRMSDSALGTYDPAANRVTRTVVEPQPIAFNPMTLKGRGQQATTTFDLPAGLYLVRMKNQGTSNFAVWLDHADTGEHADLLANTIGNFSGSHALPVKTGTYLLNVEGGSWEVTIETPTYAGAPTAPTTFTGTSASGSNVVELTRGLARFTLSAKGRGNFAVWLFGGDGKRVDLLANDIGAFDGSKAVQIPLDGPYVLDVTADGAWTIQVEQS